MKNICQQAIAYIKTIESSMQSGTRSQSVPSLEQPVLKDLGNGLLVAYVVETDNSLVYIQHRHLEEEKIDTETLHRTGLSNLVERSSNGVKIQKHGPIFGVIYDGNFEASLLLLDQIWDKELASLTPNGCVIALPARDVLAFCDLNSHEGIAVLHGMIAKVFDGGDHLLSQSLYYRDKGRWVAFAGD